MIADSVSIVSNADAAGFLVAATAFPSTFRQAGLATSSDLTFKADTTKCRVDLNYF
jgi:hypothetical protein